MRRVMGTSSKSNKRYVLTGRDLRWNLASDRARIGIDPYTIERMLNHKTPASLRSIRNISLGPRCAPPGSVGRRMSKRFAVSGNLATQDHGAHRVVGHRLVLHQCIGNALDPPAIALDQSSRPRLQVAEVFDKDVIAIAPQVLIIPARTSSILKPLLALISLRLGTEFSIELELKARAFGSIA